MAYLDHLEPVAAELGAVNVVRREPDGSLFGGMLDGAGFLAGLAAIGQDVIGKNVLLAGAAGAAAAIAFAAARAGANSIALVNRTRERAQALATKLHAAGYCATIVDRPRPAHDLVVNATSLGIRERDPSPIPTEVLEQGTVVVDIVVGTRHTALLGAAERQGCISQNGDATLAGQIELMAEFLLTPQ